MNSSGIKRGLAISAISALAVAGIPSIASADTVDAQVGAGNIVLYSQSQGAISIAKDGTNETARLEAGAGSAIASVTFQYRLGTEAAWVDIATVASRNDDGAFAYDWAAGTVAGATGLQLRVIETGNVDRATAPKAVTVSGVTTAANLRDASALGVFQTPYGTNADNVILSGTTSATEGTVELETLDGATPTLEGTATIAKATGATTGTFRQVVNIAGYAYAAPDQLVTRAAVATTTTTPGTGEPPVPVTTPVADGDDVEAYTLYRQTITNVTAAAASTNLPSGTPDTTVTVKVTDQADPAAPIAGARVLSSAGGPAVLTDANGEAKFTQVPGTARYYADATGDDGYQANFGDKQSADITVTQYAAAPNKLVGASHDGAAFDFSEQGDGDITVQVQDQQLKSFDSAQQLNYRWVITPFDTDEKAVRVPDTGTDAAPGTNTLAATADVNGKFTIPLDQGVDGTYELYASLAADSRGNNAVAETKVLTFKAGESELKTDQSSPAQADAGTSATVSGSLKLSDGTALAGRSVQATYDNGDAGNADIVLANGTATGATRTVKTDANGNFSFVVKDVKDPATTPATAQSLENGTLSLAVVNGDWTGDNVNDGNADESISVDVQFVKSTAAGSVVIEEIGTGRPGQPIERSVSVRTADDPKTNADESVALSNKTVTLNVKEGFFTELTSEGDPAPEAPKAGEYATGEYKSQGKTITVTTDDEGVARFATAIERNLGFDDDGKVSDVITATVNGVSDTEDFVWDSSDPVNGGDVRLELSPASKQESSILPKAPTTDTVTFDIYTTDQFGNLVDDEDVYATQNGQFFPSIGEDEGEFYSDLKADGDITVSAAEAGDLKLEVFWGSGAYKYNDATPPVAEWTGDGEYPTDSYTIDFYDVDFAKSSYSLTRSGAANQAVGSTVVETYKAVDQFGEPIEGVDVTFYRSGPDDQANGDGNVVRTTGENGTVTYVFQGSKAGTATITAIANQPDNGQDGAQGAVIPEAQKTDTVTFGKEIAPPPPPPPLEATLAGSSNGAKADVLKVTTGQTAAKGAVVKLFKVVNGRRVLVATKRLLANGSAKFTVKDRNAKKFTKYVAVVAKTAKSKADTSNPRNIR